MSNKNSSTKAKWRLGALLPLGAALSGVTFAAEPPADTTASEGQEVIMEDVKVKANREKKANLVKGYQAKTNTTAVKTDTKLIDLPQSLTVITQDLIKDQNMQSIADTIRYVPGVGIAQGEGNRDTPIFRGNSSTSDMYVDGIRDDVQYFRDLYNIERVDVLKGPNAMVFGRGGSGGLINRATKMADWSNTHEMNVQFGSFDKYRLTGDFDHAINDSFAVRLTSMWENSRSYREGFDAGRWGVNPTVSWRPSDQTKVTLGYEHYEDDRVADRGISSFRGRPVKTDASTFFGDPDRSPTGTTVDSFNAVLDHDFGGGVSVRNRTRYAIYDKFYQNIFPGAVNAAGNQVAISAYNDKNQRENFFNQTDLTFALDTGPFKHKFLTGMEFGYQETDNFRNTGYFTDIGLNATSVNVSLADPIYKGNIAFRQSASDANNHGVATTAAGYVQDQIQLGKHWQAIMGVRYDRFEVDFRNNRNGQNFATNDDLVSPRGGLIFKPFSDDFSLYANYSIAYVPRAGEQLASLAVSNQALKPEEFRNYELGAKWDITPDLSTTLAFFQLDRLNALATDPNNSAVSFLVDGQRTRGIELGLSGNITDAWKVIGGYAYQNAEITKSLSASALAGATLAQVPEHTFSLWNRYDITQQWGVGLGSIYRSKMYAATNNTVTLPGFLRFDAAVYYKATKNIQLQVNIENLLDKEYYASAHNNNNITPGSPIAINGGVSIKF
ncbi:MAG: TonB-dependent siderophore receptor [Methylococcaceae bacterium]|nr:TonB-dependent siderophore receptor [Methylococcaceae bacterium]MDZ4156466.1 TonB-dependent siderophore receptor [Methylococcales bacterium]MDP2391682.1 TonB-dependent siderophore receptor [Methylococcaceae bacterium]MDP3018182.1 TonB-dependent siderophore receptor [Methylococcaceae bacterium]MDP3389394.1 TonB-dependent siderophore receptor [Methylococcaceae bacterium]